MQNGIEMSGQDDREDLVEDLFHGTGETYDDIANLATWGRDKKWKKDLLDQIEAPRRILDLACGTGILLLDMLRRFECHVSGVELRPEYLDICRARATSLGGDFRLFLANVEEFEIDEQFDTITSCYVPKYVDLAKVTPSMVKMLEPGGLWIMQDFSYPKEKWVQDIFDDHFERMAIRCVEHPDWRSVWSRLPGVLRKSTWVEDCERLMLEAGLEDVTVKIQSRGMSTLVWGRKPV